MKEKWKVLPNSFGIRVSNLGNVQTFDGKNKPIRLDSEGYKCFSSKSVSRIRVHQAVAVLFVPNPLHKPLVAFKDSNKSNVSASNLIWCTQKEKAEIASKNNCFTHKKYEIKPIIAKSVSDGTLTHYESQSLAARDLEMSNSEINKCLKGKRKTSHGYTFYYDPDYERERLKTMVKRGKRYAVDDEKLLNDFSIYELSYKGQIATNVLQSQLKEHRLNANAFESLKNGGIDIESYWIRDSNINTVQIDENLLYGELARTQKYKKLANKIEGFMNVRLYKPLLGYMEFCDTLNIPYSTFCDDIDYRDYFEKVESEQMKVKTTISSQEKPKAYIKESAKSDETPDDETISKSFIGFLSQPIKWHFKDYGDDLSGITSCLARIDDFETTQTLGNYVKKHRQLFIDDYKSAIMAEWIEKQWHIRIYRPTYTEHLLHPKLTQMLYKDIYR